MSKHPHICMPPVLLSKYSSQYYNTLWELYYIQVYQAFASSSNYHAGIGSFDIKYQQLSGIGLWALVCMSVLPTKLSQLLTVMVGHYI